MKPEQLLELALAVDIEGEMVPWDSLPVDKEELFKLATLTILGIEWSEEILLASVVKLMADNLALHMMLLSK